MKKLVFTLICLLPVLTSQANIIIVDNNGPGDFDKSTFPERVIRLLSNPARTMRVFSSTTGLSH